MNVLSKVSESLAGFVNGIARGIGLNKPQKKHMSEYLVGLMIPPETRRKSVNSINELVGRKDQSSLNRFINSMKPEQLQDSWISHLKERIDRKKVYVVIDDTLAEHEDAVKMEGVASFFDHQRERYVDAHQFVTSILVTADSEEIIPFLCMPYEKIERFLGSCKCKKCKQTPHRYTQLGVDPCKCKDCRVTDFKTKNIIAKEIMDIACKNFNVVGRLFDSWYLTPETTSGELLYVSELKSNRWINLSSTPIKFADLHSGKARKNVIRKAGWKKISEYSKELLKKRNLTQRKEFPDDNLKRFCQYYKTEVYLHSGEHVSLLILYDPEKEEYKYLVSNKLYITLKEMLHSWRIRWFIEEFHKDAKDLGLGEYQLRKLHSVLIHGQFTFMAYSLLKSFVSDAERVLNQCVNTIGECSRALKRALLYAPNTRLKSLYS